MQYAPYSCTNGVDIGVKQGVFAQHGKIVWIGFHTDDAGFGKHLGEEHRSISHVGASILRVCMVCAHGCSTAWLLKALARTSMYAG